MLLLLQLQRKINKYLNEGSQTSTDVMNRKEFIIIRRNREKKPRE